MLEGILQKFLTVGYLKYDKGAIKFGDEKMLFVNLYPLIEQYIFNQKVGSDIFNYISYVSFKKSNFNFTKRHFVNFGNSLASVADISKKTFYALGWAETDIIKIDEKRNFMLIQAKRSTFADEMKALHGPQNEPVDYMMTGIFAGAMQFYSPGKDIYCVETRCRAQKNVTSCEFVASTEKAIMDYVRKFCPKEEKSIAERISNIKKAEKRLGIKYESK